jgi:hypothetical protein
MFCSIVLSSEAALSFGHLTYPHLTASLVALLVKLRPQVLEPLLYFVAIRNAEKCMRFVFSTKIQQTVVISKLVNTPLAFYHLALTQKKALNEHYIDN